jgi:uncharacterized protein (TIGR02001 family)
MSKAITISSCVIAAISLGLCTSALADGGSLKDATATAASDARQFKFDWNLGVTSDYIFRGFSQNKGHPAIQGGMDITYGTFYAGFWSSNIDFKPNSDFRTGTDYSANPELDLYLGFKPVVKTERGDLNFDIGVIAYTYPGEKSPGGDVTYEELKFGVNKDIWKNGNLSSTFWYSPNYTLGTGSVETTELTFTQTFEERQKWVPSVSGTWGHQWGHSTAYQVLIGNGASEYNYWNAGATFTYDSKLSLDFRYWGTDIKSNNGSGTYSYNGTQNFANGFCDGPSLQCGNRFSATVKYTY